MWCLTIIALFGCSSKGPLVFIILNNKLSYLRSDSKHSLFSYSINTECYGYCGYILTMKIIKKQNFLFWSGKLLVATKRSTVWKHQHYLLNIIWNWKELKNCTTMSSQEKKNPQENKFLLKICKISPETKNGLLEEISSFQNIVSIFKYA